MLRILTLTGCVVLSGVGAAQTYFGPGGPATSFYGGLLFDVKNVSSTDIQLTGNVKFATSWTGDGAYRIYTKAGSYVGSEMTLGNWTFFGETTANGVASGLTQANFGATKSLLAGETIGVAIFHVGGSGHAAGNGALGYRSGANTFSDGSLQFTTGTVKGYGLPTDPFNVHSVPGRTWAGEMEYKAVPEPASLAALGLGVAALIRRRRR